MSGLIRARKHLLNFEHVLNTRGSLVLPASFPPRLSPPWERSWDMT